MSTLYIKTFGCQMNVYDSDKMADVLHAEHGLTQTDSPDGADVVLLNTCSVRDKAQEKTFHDLGRLRELKLKNPQMIIGVGGCVASQEGAAILKRAPYVDVIFGPQTLHRLPQMIDARRTTGRAQVDISFPEIEKFDNLPPPRVEGITAFVSIMEGCSKYCSFCVVPYTRGEEINRPFADVIREISQLAEQGVREVTLLGQNVNAYRGPMQDGDIADFALLLEQVHAIEGIERIRYSTSHPKEFTQRLIDVYAHLPKLVSHVHLPVQSGSDRVLSAMKRGYTALEYKSIIRRLKAVRPDINITSDFIVGFPGESDADFDATMNLIDYVGFDGSYSFLYSPRPGTPASELVDDTPHEIKMQRLARLQKRADELNAEISAKMVGTTQRVLVEGVSARDAHEIYGRTDNNRVVNFAGDLELIGRFTSVKITQAVRYTLRGESVNV
jgi:tRNA-2-methylthio-N6-dimethylallyladenosine synthase